LLDPVNAIAGLLVFCVALIIFELRKNRAGGLSAQSPVRPLLTWLWR